MNQSTEDLRNLSKEQLEQILNRIKNTKINVLLIGGTGVGKSSTVNAMFATSNDTAANAAVGTGANPETMDVHAYHLKNMVIWDTPGLGDSAEKDLSHAKQITELLERTDGNGNPLIDLVFLVLDGSSRDFSSAYTLIKEVVSPHLRGDDKNRLLIGINKADKVMHHKFWDQANNLPTPKLQEELNERANIVRERIQADTGFSPAVIYYSAGEIVDGEAVQTPYNLAKLLSFIIDRLPLKKRAALAGDINQNRENFEANDADANYKEKIERSFLDSVKEIATDVLGHAREYIGEILKNPEVRDSIVSAGAAFIKSLFSGSANKDKTDKKSK